MISKKSLVRYISIFMLLLLFATCNKSKTVETKIETQKLTLEDKIEGKWYLMTYYVYRVIDEVPLLLDSPRVELQNPIENSFVKFSSYQDIEFKTPRGRSLYRSWKIKDSTIYSGCSNNIPKDCNFGNTHALFRGAFKIVYLDEKEIELICTSNFEPGSKTIEKVQLLKKE